MLGLSLVIVVVTVLVGICRAGGCMLLNCLAYLSIVLVLCRWMLLIIGRIRATVLPILRLVCGMMAWGLVAELCRLT